MAVLAVPYCKNIKTFFGVIMDWLHKLKTIEETPPAALSKLPKAIEQEKPIITDPKSLSHYCQPADCWCSAKLAGSCRRHNCEHYQALQTTNEVQGILTLAP